MKRRTVLAALGVGLAGTTAIVRIARADIAVDPSVTRGRGDPITIERIVDDPAIEYRSESNEVQVDSTTLPFERWARTECVEVAAPAVLPVVEDRVGRPLEGVGRGIRGLFFGLTVTVDHNDAYDRDGTLVSEPNVGFEELVAVTPRAVTATVLLDGREYTRTVAVAVEHQDLHQL